MEMVAPRPPPRFYLGCEIKSGRRPGNEAKSRGRYPKKAAKPKYPERPSCDF